MKLILSNQFLYYLYFAKNYYPSFPGLQCINCWQNGDIFFTNSSFALYQERAIHVFVETLLSLPVSIFPKISLTLSLSHFLSLSPTTFSLSPKAFINPSLSLSLSFQKTLLSLFFSDLLYSDSFRRFQVSQLEV